MISKTPAQVSEKIALKIDVEAEDIETAYPCTALQAALLAANLQGSGTYVSTFLFNISASSLRPQDVRQACEVLYHQTPVLRTRFFQSKGSFLQAITNSPLTWSEHKSVDEFVDLDKERQVQIEDVHANFAWIEGAGDVVYMIWSLHHALYDEWSFSLLLADLSLLLTAPKSSVSRPNFSRFVKAQSLIDQKSSRSFWAGAFQTFEDVRPLVHDADSFETSRNAECSGPIAMAHHKHQASTIAIASWAIFLTSLARSDTVCFGNIVNGRTADIPGILDICGPTMTTVPYLIDIPWDEPIDDFLETLEKLRNDMLPYEQTGLTEYRQITGSGRFETLLSVRSSQAGVSNETSKLEPSTAVGRQVRHPCCLYLDVVFDEAQCTLKASFDERYVDGDRISESLEAMLTCVRTVSDRPTLKVKEVSGFMNLSRLMLESNQGNPTDTSADPSALEVDSSILHQVQETAQEVSPLQQQISIEADTSLRELGFDSLSTVMFARRLGVKFGITIPFREVTGLRRSVLDVSRSIQSTLDGDERSKTARLDLLELAGRHVKSFQLEIAMQVPPSGMNGVLLTGASGYVGIEILRQLLASCEDRIILLVRCESSKDGLERINRAARIAHWQEEELSLLAKRVEIWPADLGAPELGLSDRCRERLKTVRTIIHNGARVDFSMDYHDLADTNVSATAFLLSQHLRHAAQPSFVYVTGGRGSPIDLVESLEDIAGKLASSGGYAQSKFVSEVLLYRASDLCREAGQDPAISIIHPGAVIGSRDTGVANTDDFVWRYVAASVQMGAYVPAVPTKREWINMMSVDSVAHEVVAAPSMSHDAGGVRRVSMRSGLSVTQFWGLIVKVLGSSYKLEPVSEWEWLRRLEAAVEEEGSRHPLFSLSHLLSQGVLKGIGGPGLRPSQMPEKEEIRCTESAVESNLRYLEQVGFFSSKTTDHREKEVFVRSKR